MKYFFWILLALFITGCSCADTKPDTDDEHQERVREMRMHRFDRI